MNKFEVVLLLNPELSSTNLKSEVDNFKTKLVSQSANIGDLRTRSGRFYPSIDLYHADKDMSHLIKKELIPFFRKEYAKDIKTFTKQYIGTPERIEAGFSTPMFKAWAAPYLALTDYSYEAFGVQNPMGVNY